MPKLPLLVLLTMSVGACAPAISSTSAACPSLPIYSKELQEAAADEIDALPDGSVLGNIMMPDYGRMRAGVRECIKARDENK
jgi:hypothetical protein